MKHVLGKTSQQQQDWTVDNEANIPLPLCGAEWQDRSQGHVKWPNRNPQSSWIVEQLLKMFNETKHNFNKCVHFLEWNHWARCSVYKFTCWVLLPSSDHTRNNSHVFNNDFYLQAVHVTWYCERGLVNVSWDVSLLIQDASSFLLKSEMIKAKKQNPAGPIWDCSSCS